MICKLKYLHNLKRKKTCNYCNGEIIISNKNFIKLISLGFTRFIYFLILSFFFAHLFLKSSVKCVWLLLSMKLNFYVFQYEHEALSRSRCNPIKVFCVRTTCLSLARFHKTEMDILQKLLFLSIES